MPERPRLLLVEDEADLAEVLSYRFERQGFLVDTLAAGDQALELSRGRDYRIFVLDVMLPGLKGLELCRMLREDWRSRQAGILVCSAMGPGLDRQAVLDAGADDYLPKPLDLELLVRRVEALSQRQGLRPGAVFSWPALGLELDALRLHLDGRSLPLSPEEAGLLKALALMPESKWQGLDRLGSLMWSLGQIQSMEELGRLLASLAAKTRRPGSGRPAVVELDAGRGVRFNPR